MAEEEKEVEAAPEKKKFPMVILVAVLVVVGLVLAAGISFFVTTKLMADTASDSGASKYHDPGIFHQLGDPKEGTLVNVGGSKAGKFLKTRIILEMNPGKKDNVVEGVVSPVASTKIEDTVIQMLRASRLEEFDASKQDELKKKIKDRLNEVLGEGSVYDVYITSFLLQ